MSEYCCSVSSGWIYDEVVSVSVDGCYEADGVLGDGAVVASYGEVSAGTDGCEAVEVWV